MKSSKLRIILLLFFMTIILSVIEAQEVKYHPQLINEFRNVNESGGFFFREHVGEDDRTGNDLVFDPTGRMFVYQWEQDQVYEVDSRYQLSRVVILPVNESRDVRRLVKADGVGFLFFNFYGIETYYDNQGVPIFHTEIYDLMQEPVVSIEYVSDILFLLDRKGRLHSVVNPSMDEGGNQLNYKTPEETIKMFEKGSKVDLKGLTRDDRGILYLKGRPVYLSVKNIGQYKYQFLRTDIYITSEGKTKIALSLKTTTDEVLESATLHPSGDVYFLNYNKVSNMHILYKIENTWDPEAKKEWEQKYKS